jgi:CAP-Gly domain-containing linker protein 1
MEDRLAEKSRRIKQLEADLAQRLEAAPPETPAPAADPAQTNRIATLEADLAAQLEASQKLKLEAKHKSAAMEAQVESLRERLDAAAQEHTRERDQLRSEVDKLRTAGQALCETYEEKIAEIELARLEAVDLVESLQAQLQQQQQPTPPVMNDTTTTAATIDAETARAEVEHLRSKVGSLEDQLEQVRHQLEQEIGDARERRARHQEVEAALKEQIRSLKEAVGEPSPRDFSATNRD